MGRYSLTPLVEAMNLGPDDSVCRALGVSGASVTRYAVNGMEEATAERLACRAGFHPSSIWPSMLDDAIDDVERTCAADDCEARFLPPLRGFQKFCGQTCRRREKMRRYRSRPNGARVNRTHRARYYAENGDYERAQKRKRAA